MKKNRSIFIIPAIAIILIASSFAEQSKVTVKGSDTMVILAQKWAELYMKQNPAASIQVTGGGSGVGITALINGTTDITNASRPMKQAEIEKLKARYNTLGVQIPCAKDGITIFLNEANKVEELTLKQLSDIYQGKIRNWKELGGNDAEIRMYGRENSSGTYTYFHDEVVKADYAASVQSLPGTAAVAIHQLSPPRRIGAVRGWKGSRQRTAPGGRRRPRRGRQRPSRRSPAGGAPG